MDTPVYRNREIPIKERMTAWIDHVAGFYNTGNRSLHVYSSDACVYAASERSPGCAIGKEDPIFAQFDDADNSSSIKSVFQYEQVTGKTIVPDWMRDFGATFLQAIQDLHDNADNWNENGLTAFGRERVDYVKRRILNGTYDGK